MIETKNGVINITGSMFDVLADFSTVVRTLNESLTNSYGEDKAKKILEIAFNDGLMRDEERHKSAEELRKFQKGVTKTFAKAMFDL